MKTVIPLIPLLFAISCQPKAEESSQEETTPPPTEKTAPSAEKKPTTVLNPAKIETLLGQPLKEVQAACDKADVTHRVVIIDGEGLPVTMDMRPERLNFTVEKGIVTKVTKG